MNPILSNKLIEEVKVVKLNDESGVSLLIRGNDFLYVNVIITATELYDLLKQCAPELLNSKSRFETEANDDSLPHNPNQFNLGPAEFTAGERIGWWYKDDETFMAGEGLPHPKNNPPYSGIVVARPDAEIGYKIAAEDAVIVMDCYPVEKCNCESTYIAYRQLIDSEDLGGVVKLRE